MNRKMIIDALRQEQRMIERVITLLSAEAPTTRGVGDKVDRAFAKFASTHGNGSGKRIRTTDAQLLAALKRDKGMTAREVAIAVGLQTASSLYARLPKLIKAKQARKDKAGLFYRVGE